MENKTMHELLVNGYVKNEYSDNFIFGFDYNDNVICSITDSTVLSYVTYVDCASRGGGYSLRYRPNKAQKELLLTKQTFVLCSVSYFKSVCKELPQYNKGEIFEKLVTEFYGQAWTKDHVPFTDAGDIEIDGIAYQIKYNKATFLSEKGLMKIQNGTWGQRG